MKVLEGYIIMWIAVTCESRDNKVIVREDDFVSSKLLGKCPLFFNKICVVKLSLKKL